jgi:hypothetical protein
MTILLVRRGHPDAHHFVSGNRIFTISKFKTLVQRKLVQRQLVQRQLIQRQLVQRQLVQRQLVQYYKCISSYNGNSSRTGRQKIELTTPNLT